MKFPALDIVRACYTALLQGDWPALHRLISPELEISQTQEPVWNGPYQGHTGLSDYFGRLLQGLCNQLIPDSVQFVSLCPERVAMVGCPLSTTLTDPPILHIWTVYAGRVTRFEAFSELVVPVTAPCRSVAV